MTSAQYKSQKVTDGFMQGTEVGASVQIGTEVTMKASITLKAKTVSNVFNELCKYKKDFHADTWQKIEKAHASGSASFFYVLLGLSADASYDYENQTKQENISADVQSQRIAEALHTTQETEVKIEGEVKAVGQSYVPVQAYIFIHLTQVRLNDNAPFNAVANQPGAKAANKDGSQSGVTGSGKLNVISADNPAFYSLAAMGVLKSEVHIVHKKQE